MKSVIKLYGLAVRHPWLDTAGVWANHPRIRTWDMNNSVGKAWYSFAVSSGRCSLRPDLFLYHDLRVG